MERASGAMGSSSVTWRDSMPALARRLTVIAPDLLGQGPLGEPAIHP